MPVPVEYQLSYVAQPRSLGDRIFGTHKVSDRFSAAKAALVFREIRQDND